MSIRRSVAAAVLALGVMWGCSITMSANGQEFFPAGQGPVDLVYFGLIKDAATGRAVTDHAYITIRDNVTGMSVPFTGDRPGHFRSPDIGLLIKELGEAADPAQIELTLVVPGYQKFVLKKMPRRANGAVDVTVRLLPANDAAPVAAAGVSPASSEQLVIEGAPPLPAAPRIAERGMATYSVAMIVFAIAVAASAIVAVGRTRGLRASTSH